MSKNTKKQKTTSGKRFILPLIAAGILIAALALLVMPQNGTKASDGAVLSEDQMLTIPLSAVTESASFYPVSIDGTAMEVLAIRTASGEVRTAFNTCQSCYTSGNGYYVADGTELICQNCGFHFTAEEVGLEGRGCNPWPIPAAERTETEDSVVISYDTLAGAKDIFAHWSKEKS